MVDHFPFIYVGSDFHCLCSFPFLSLSYSLFNCLDSTNGLHLSVWLQYINGRVTCTRYKNQSPRDRVAAVCVSVCAQGGLLEGLQQHASAGGAGSALQALQQSVEHMQVCDRNVVSEMWCKCMGRQAGAEIQACCTYDCVVLLQVFLLLL